MGDTISDRVSGEVGEEQACRSRFVMVKVIKGLLQGCGSVSAMVPMLRKIAKNAKSADSTPSQNIGKGFFWGRPHLDKPKAPVLQCGSSSLYGLLPLKKPPLARCDFLRLESSP